MAQDNQLGGDGGAASLIKKELDERLTEEQRRQKQVRRRCEVYLSPGTLN